ncbi:hypothetical protein HZB93_02995 [Candidatus Falkowbacteria bacterium]|nr:hypothetical protein [Candidatus Falkowbacteria bacterium]
MKVKDGVFWQRFRAANSGRYELRLLNYAERWADRMEAKLNQGLRLEDIVEKTIDDPILRVSNSQVAHVMIALFRFWEHGEALKNWRDQNWGAVRARRGG